MKKNDYELDSKSSLFTHKMVKPEPDRYVEALAEQSSRLKIGHMACNLGHLRDELTVFTD